MVATGTLHNRTVTRSASIPLSRPALGQAEVDAVARAILSGWVTQGPEVAAFETEFAQFVGAPHACAVSNCTVALHLALRAVGVRAGDEVVTVSHSFIATANAVRYCGAVPVFVDIERDTFNIDPARVEEAISPRTKALLVVHQMGMPANLAVLLRIAAKRGLRVVEDAACAIGSEIEWQGRWERIGRPHGDVACFSFHPRKLLTTGDGGMITTADPAIDRRVRGWRQHAMSVPDTVRHGSRQVVIEEYSELGYNYRMTDLQAAMGRVQLQRLPGLLAARRAIAARYHRLLEQVPGLGLPVQPEFARTNWQSFAVRLPAHSDQREVMQSLLDAGIASRRGVMCAHLEPAYRSELWACARDLSHSEEATRQSIILPLYPDLTPADQDAVADVLAEACTRVAGRSAS